MILKLKAKVLLSSEEQMEVEATYDIGDLNKDKQWVWRSVGIPVEEVYRITEYNKNKTLVELNGGEKIMVAESFDQVFSKWNSLREMESYHEESTEESEKQIDEEEE